MSINSLPQAISLPSDPIIRTERGLIIAGTRITLYDVMDYLKLGYPVKFIRDAFHLSDQQIEDVLAYLEAHPTQVEAEYQDMVQMAEDIRHYWENHNRDHFARLAADPVRSGDEAVRVKLKERKQQRQSHQL